MQILVHREPFCPKAEAFIHPAAQEDFVVLLVVPTGIGCCCHFGNNYERVVFLVVSTGIACC